ncbi:ATP-dependent metallopeptidase FtsH/Yme1/Tma family protein [Leptolyngbya sp. CCNP1308]|uniref:PLD nuclease N-terminal domain-containing protein n=1 Tax=Leptolyngbya sp. CCNP1308 TaxID=3110255 RepID=UPI002B1F27EC|nr:ATP-dependent metallopeptidase FtsH/Yme1/Tma family protein [Leptolyngbya sp. CCNP1308]MEA5449551.1 ATP-dependent metallopeptidase FtsH/Yme1/Tma family protein [Leptolyngbya sp. CCNP1308]
MSMVDYQNKYRQLKVAAHFRLVSLLIVVLLIVTACVERSPSTIWSYNQFVQAIKQGQVAAVDLDAERSQAIAHTKDGEIIAVELPNDPALVDLLTQHDVAITVAPQSTQFDLQAIVFPLIIVFLILLGFLFWLWVLIDCATHESSAGNTKIVWVLIILFANGIGALVYFFFRRPQRRRELGQ